MKLEIAMRVYQRERHQKHLLFMHRLLLTSLGSQCDVNILVTKLPIVANTLLA